MNTATKTVLVIAFSIVVGLLLLFAAGAMTGAVLHGGIMGSGTMAGINWMWIPIFPLLTLGALLIWALFGQAEDPTK